VAALPDQNTPPMTITIDQRVETVVSVVPSPTYYLGADDDSAVVEISSGSDGCFLPLLAQRDDVHLNYESAT